MPRTPTTSPPFELRAGPGALAHVQERGLSPTDLACLPAAAGGPKGLVLLPLDRLLLQEWLPRVPRLELVGASIGAWRMAALAQPGGLAALARLEHAYAGDQRYSRAPDQREVSEACRRIARAVLGDATDIVTRAGVSLSVITARARGVLHDDASKPAFARAVLSNALSRTRLARHLERVLFRAGGPSFLDQPFDQFGSRTVAFDARNAEDALLASGTIPLLAEPVRDIAGAPHGNYWDGALVDYHLLLPYPRLARAGHPGLVFYPHFSTEVTAGWLDKHLPWRRHAGAHPWLANVLLVAPSPAFLERLPNRKLPDRNDFYRYGTDHAGRIRDWARAIGESGRFAEAVLRWMEQPDPSLLKPL
jgi:predicted acylesterase/phospholipase RssA